MEVFINNPQPIDGVNENVDDDPYIKWLSYYQFQIK